MFSLLHELWGHKLKFFLTFFVVLMVSYLALVAVDFVPEEPAVEVIPETMVEEKAEPAPIVPAIIEEVTVLPTAITIPRLDKVVPVLNPTSRSIADLDAALLEGVVRHPDSALVGQTGNVFILGHSSYLPNVLNRHFQAFNGIQSLEWGDTIEVATEAGVYIYRVEKVYQAQASNVTVPIDVSEKMLTLATCNSFGSVDDRYIVEAIQVDIRPLEA